MRVRIPGWAQNQPLPGDLYRYANTSAAKPEILVNGESVSYETEQGYAVLDREWNTGDEVELSLPMQVRTVKASELVADDKGKVAIERGPIVYCVEEKDNPEIGTIQVSEGTQFESNYNADLLAGVEVIKASGKTKEETFTAIPYYVWNNRGANKMDVWLSKVD